MVEILCRTRMAGRWFRLDRLRLSRRADALWMAFNQLAIWHRGYVRLSQGQLFLLQSLVGRSTGLALISALELGRTRWGDRPRLGAFESRRGRTSSEWHKPGQPESSATHASRMES